MDYRLPDAGYFRYGLRHLQKRAHDIAAEHGWWEEPREFGTMIALVHSEASEALEAMREADSHPARTWYKYTMPGPLESVLPEASVAVGRLRQLVSGNYMSAPDTPPDELTDAENAILRRYGYAKPEGVPSELADIVIRVMDIAEFYGIDLAQAILDKMEYNNARPYKHGRKAF